MMRTAITVEALKATPPVTITALATIGNLTLNEWVSITTICYIGLQAVFLAWKWNRERKIKNGN